MARALVVNADVSLESAFGRFELTGQGGRLGLALPTEPVRLGLLARTFRHRRSIGRLAARLSAAGTTLTVTRAGREIGRLGSEARAGAVLRRLRLEHVSIRPRRLLALVWGGRP